MKALIFFGHGARDARWREPFDRLSALWRDQQPQVPSAVAFLEMMEPNLAEAVAQLVGQGANSIQVIPVFFGQGGHLRNDFPKLLEACQLQFPQVSLSASSAIGEDTQVLQAIIDFSSRAI